MLVSARLSPLVTRFPTFNAQLSARPTLALVFSEIAEADGSRKRSRKRLQNDCKGSQLFLKKEFDDRGAQESKKLEVEN